MTDGGADLAARVLAELAPRLGRIIASALESDPDVALSLRQFRVLERVAQRPHRTGELAVTVDVRQPTVSATIAALESRGLVRREPDPSDGRATLIEISDAGQQVLTRARRRVVERLSVITSEMTAEDAEALVALQPILAKGMDRLREHLRASRQ